MNKRISLIIIGMLCVNFAYAHTINWKVDGITQSTTTCNAGDNVTPPSAPAKTGYTFVRWAPLYDFSTLNTSANGAHHYGKGESDGNDYCLYDGNTVTCDSSFDDLARQQWKTPFSWGTIYGDAMCSTTSGTYATAGTPTSDDGQYCWCLGTGYKPSGSDVVYSPSSPLSWVFGYDYTASFCKSLCANRCAHRVKQLSDFRQAVFGAVQ